MNIKIIKLITSEEIVAEVVSGDVYSESIKIKNAVALMLQPTRDGKLSYGFVPFGAMIDGDISIKNSNIVYFADINEDLKNNYNSMFGGIVTPPKTLITG
jgi:hypothetical protein